jgi:hypothetical protein
MVPNGLRLLYLNAMSMTVHIWKTLIEIYESWVHDICWNGFCSLVTAHGGAITDEVSKIDNIQIEIDPIDPIYSKDYSWRWTLCFRRS